MGPTVDRPWANSKSDVQDLSNGSGSGSGRPSTSQHSVTQATSDGLVVPAVIATQERFDLAPEFDDIPCYSHNKTEDSYDNPSGAAAFMEPVFNNGDCPVAFHDAWAEAFSTRSFSVSSTRSDAHTRPDVQTRPDAQTRSDTQARFDTRDRSTQRNGKQRVLFGTCPMRERNTRQKIPLHHRLHVPFISGPDKSDTSTRPRRAPSVYVPSKVGDKGLGNLPIYKNDLKRPPRVAIPGDMKTLGIFPIEKNDYTPRCRAASPPGCSSKKGISNFKSHLRLESNQLWALISELMRLPFSRQPCSAASRTSSRDEDQEERGRPRNRVTCHPDSSYH